MTRSVQQRGGSGDKGRDIIVWLDPPSAQKRRWHLYQCKHYGARLSPGTAATEIGKVIYHVFAGSYIAPEEYWFVTHLGVSGTLQDLLDDPAKLRAFVLNNWKKHCETKIAATPIPLTSKLETFINTFDFSIFRAKQPLEIIKEHAKTRYHLTVFGAPLVDRPPPPKPPSSVAPSERSYVEKLYEVIAEELKISINDAIDFAHSSEMRRLFDRSRITFYSAEGLRELARDQMADADFFESLLADFENGLFHTYSADADCGLMRLRATIRAAQALQLGHHVLEPHTTPLDREGICHQLANNGVTDWCKD